MRESVSFWKDGFRRLKKNKVAMTSLIVILLVMIFSFIVFLPQFYRIMISVPAVISRAPTVVFAVIGALLPLLLPLALVAAAFCILKKA